MFLGESNTERGKGLFKDTQLRQRFCASSLGVLPLPSSTMGQESYNVNSF